MRIDGGGYRQDHLRALAERVELGDDEVRIMGSKSDLLRTLVAAEGGISAAIGPPSQGPKWRKRWDSNPRNGCPLAGFQDRFLKPLGHSSCVQQRLERVGRFVQAFVALGGSSA